MGRKVRRVKVPLKIKLSVFVALLLFFTILAYIYFALDLFKKDKSAYIYESSLANSEYLAEEINGHFNSLVTNVLLVTKSSKKNNRLIKEIFKSRDDLLQYTVFKKRRNNYEKIFEATNKRLLSENNISEKRFIKQTLTNVIPFRAIKNKRIYLKSEINNEIPYLLLGLNFKNDSNIYVVKIMLNHFVEIFNKSRIYESYLIDQSGWILVHKKLDQFVNNASRIEDPAILSIVNSKIDKGVKEFVRKGNTDKYLFSFSKLNDYGIYVISEIDNSLAYKAASYLIKKSIYFGIFVLCLAILIGLLLARGLTSSLDKLFEGTQKIAKGDFNSTVVVKSSDEIGVLSDSFNFMSKEILRYMGEMKEKARLENEMAVAQLVQSSFFPENDIKRSNLEIAAFHTSASECGGDWWGILENGDKSIIIIADATGHGVPAALLTATAHCSFNSLKEISKIDPSILESPSRMMNYMNISICKAGKEILMTCFIGIIDPQNRKVVYSNASHNQPFVYTDSNQAPDKSSFKPLMGANGTRLGHKFETVYEDDHFEIKSGDGIIMYTDGIIEAVNSKEKQYGQRRFIKSLSGGIKENASRVRDQLVKDAYDYYENVPVDDDVTLLVTKVV